MSMQYVTIMYGPSNSYHTLAHKPQKLAGLRDRLRKLGYRVDLVPVKGVNECQIVMCGNEVFRCNINNLMFNSPYEVDVVCQRAVQAVVDATTKLFRARNHLYFLALLQQQAINGGKFDFKNYYTTKSEDASGIPASFAECTKCCGILTKKDT